MCAILITVKARSYSPRLFTDVEQQDEVWGLDHPRDVSVPGVGWRVGVTILPLLIEAKPPCFFTKAEIEYLTRRIQDDKTKKLYMKEQKHW
nr:malate dehydrogenase, glyoxysomal [Tanacetum cinerariifolium]